MTRCPCLSGLAFAECCEPVLRGERLAPTAEALMRSRFTAFARGDVAWLRAPWHPRTRPDTRLGRRRRLGPLDILDTWAGGPFDDAGGVEFVASWRSPATPPRAARRR